jgi:hypothetical protein
MSLSADFHAAKQKSGNKLEHIAEAHPVLAGLAAMACLLTALTVVTQYLLH